MKTRIPLLAAVAVAVAPMLLGATSSQASPRFDGPTWGEALAARVRYTDLDLSTAKGRAVLERRIALAVDAVCALPHAEQLGQRARVADCRAEARRQADATLARLPRGAGAVARSD